MNESDDRQASLSGWEWADLLKAQPQFAAACDWSKLSDDDLKNLLTDHPETMEYLDPSAALRLLEQMGCGKYVENAFLAKFPPKGRKGS